MNINFEREEYTRSDMKEFLDWYLKLQEWESEEDFDELLDDWEENKKLQ